MEPALPGAVCAVLPLNDSNDRCSRNRTTLAGWAVLGMGILAILPGNYYTISDQRLKTNISPLTGSLDKVMRLKCYSYDANKETYPKYFASSRKMMGFLAQKNSSR